MNWTLAGSSRRVRRERHGAPVAARASPRTLRHDTLHVTAASLAAERACRCGFVPD